MSVYKPKGKEWYMVDVYDSAGRRIRKKAGRSRKLALDIEADLKTKILKREFLGVVDEKKIVFKDFVEEFLSWVAVNLAEATYKRYRYTIHKSMVPRWGNLPLQHITIKMIDDFKTARVKKVKPASVNEDLICIMAMFRQAKRWGYVQESPCRGGGLMFKQHKGSTRFLSYREARRLLEGCKGSKWPDLHDLMLTGLHTGMRLGEILYLLWNDIDQSMRTIRVVSREEHRTKTGESRTVPLSTLLGDALKRRVRHLGSPYVFCDDQGKARRIEVVSRTFTKVVSRIGIEHITFHGLRHTFASWAVMNGVDLPTLQKILGHASIQTTMRYAHLAPEHLRGAVSFLDRQQMGNEADRVQEAAG